MKNRKGNVSRERRYIEDNKKFKGVGNCASLFHFNFTWKERNTERLIKKKSN